MTRLAHPAIWLAWGRSVTLSLALTLTLLGVVASGCGEDAPPSFDDTTPTDTGDLPDADLEDADLDSTPLDAGPRDVGPGGDATPDGADGGSDTDDSDTADTDAAPTEDVERDVDSGPTCGPGVCGNGVLDPGELCDPASPLGFGACPSQCFDGVACTHNELIGFAALCSATCLTTPVTACGPADGCCPPGCGPGGDPDCSPTCGDGILDPGETCDGDCPTQCDDGDPCTDDLLVGDPAGCSAECVHLPRPGCLNLDTGCCGAACSPAAVAACSQSVCGNGVLEPGERCDGDCPTDCPSSGCDAGELVGSASRCTAQCRSTLGCEDGDGCCPSGCSFNEDDDCTTLRCLCIECEPAKPQCAWHGLEQEISEALLCGTAFGEPTCATKDIVLPCPSGCDAGECAPEPCTSPTGAPRIDFCGNGLDEDCDGEPRDCAQYPSAYALVHAELVLTGCAVSAEQLALWQLAATQLGDAVSTRVRVRNEGGATVGVTGAEGTLNLAEGQEELVESGATWSAPGAIAIQAPGCPERTIEVAYGAAPEPPTWLEGAVRVAAGTPQEQVLSARVELSVVPVPLGQATPQAANPPAHLRECAGYALCTALSEARFVVDGAGEIAPLDVVFHPETPSRPFFTWTVVGPLLHLTLSGPDGAPFGSVKGPPHLLKGTFTGLAPALEGAEWALQVR